MTAPFRNVTILSPSEARAELARLFTGQNPEQFEGRLGRLLGKFALNGCREVDLAKFAAEYSRER